ncbi:DNA processing protein [Promicromonospora sp. AC04]|uniref:DNA-processing protein DprA n=1 Tax=Promicromonospora sp. AC04 TaxID=2135723 RepID=UPI000D4F4FBC|nr:DNA-processing protein DprA [Promicromonospora sp. AC04]PUB20890.1 DNA processing protein [Promicromonospora sp. AC04]
MNQDIDEIADMATDERTARIILTLGCEPGDGLAARLVAEQGALSTVHQIAGATGPNQRMAQWRGGIAQRLDLAGVNDVLSQTRDLGLGTLIPSDPGWPALAGDATAHPLVLWTLGDSSVLVDREPRVAMVGARVATDYGQRVTRDLAAGLAQLGVTVVTTGGHGIDTAAAIGTAAGDGRSIAVLPGGLDRPYPSSNAGLFHWITGDGGVLVSAEPPGQRTGRTRQVLRGRLVAALSDAVVVTEAGHHTSALKIAHEAVRLGRPVGAVPGEITIPSSAGSNELLRQHTARVITHASDAMDLITAPRPATPPVAAGNVSSRRDPSRPRPPEPGPPISPAMIPL